MNFLLDKPYFALYTGNIISREKENTMSCSRNEMLMETLFEKYLEEGYSDEVAEEKAIEEFENRSY